MSSKTVDRQNARMMALGWLEEAGRGVQVISAASQASIVGGDTPPILIDSTLDETGVMAIICMTEGDGSGGGPVGG